MHQPRIILYPFQFFNYYLFCFLFNAVIIKLYLLFHLINSIFVCKRKAP